VIGGGVDRSSSFFFFFFARRIVVVVNRGRLKYKLYVGSISTSGLYISHMFFSSFSEGSYVYTLILLSIGPVYIQLF
jgi:hypothetical protein